MTKSSALTSNVSCRTTTGTNTSACLTTLLNIDKMISWHPSTALVSSHGSYEHAQSGQPYAPSFVHELPCRVIKCHSKIYALQALYMYKSTTHYYMYGQVRSKK